MSRRVPMPFLHLDSALAYPDPAWRLAMEALPAPVPEPGARRAVTRQATPWALVIVGPNGAGKSTLYRTRLARLLPGVPFVNADDLSRLALGRHARDLKEAQLGQSLVASRQADLLAEGEDFIWETVFSHASRIDRLLEWKAAGYQVGLVGLYPGSADVSVARVARRVTEGGHPVPEDKIRGRFLRTPGLMAQASAVVDGAWWLDSSAPHCPPVVVARWLGGELQTPQSELPAWAAELSAAR